jgi:hypothetical protein
MHLKKKMFAIAIITLLTLSIFAVVLPAYAIGVPSLFAADKTTPITTPQNVGTKIWVSGTGAVLFSTVNVYWDSTLSSSLLNTTSADSTGAFGCFINIPAAINGTHQIIVVDSSGVPSFEDIDVKPSLSAGFPPVRGMPGDVLTVTGRGFGASKAVNLNFTFTNGTVVADVTPSGLTTNATGSFTAQIAIPTILPANFGNYLVNATDAINVTATVTISVDYYVTVFPISGPSGITITISGRIPANTAYTTGFSTQTAFSGTSDGTGRFTGTFVVPALVVPGTDYAITVTWGVTNTRTASPSFKASAAPTITRTPVEGAAGTVVTLSGTGFSSRANITASLGSTVVNSTALDARFAKTSIMGAFTGLTFTVPSITPGTYYLTVTDQYGASTGNTYNFKVLPTPETIVALRGATYYPMDTLSFNIWTTESSLTPMTVSIYDPSGVLWWRVSSWPLTASDDGTYKTVLFEHQGADNGYDQMKLTLPADAPLGSWNWTITYTPATPPAALKKATGLFTVVASTADTVINKINELGTNMTTLLNSLEASIVDVVTDSEGDLTAVINTKAGQITTKLDAIGAQIQGIEDMSIIIATDVGEIKVAIADLDLGTMGVDITAIKGDVATIKTNLGTVTTSVAALDAKVVALDGDVATVSTNLGTLEGKVTALDGKVATVNTSVGTVQADVSDIKAKPAVDMTPVWIAVVLSLIAAIAAIFAVVTIRQKIAG